MPGDSAVFNQIIDEVIDFGQNIIVRALDHKKYSHPDTAQWINHINQDIVNKLHDFN